MKHDNREASLESPDTLTPAECDLRDFPFMQVDVARLRDSDLAALETPEACWAAMLLWCAAWHQVPAASLPDDDTVLARIAGYGRCVHAWKKIRKGALRGFIKCRDGRLYHPVVAEKANAAWKLKLQHNYAKFEGRMRKHNKKRVEQGLAAFKILSFEQWLIAGYPAINQELEATADAGCLQSSDRKQNISVDGMQISGEIPSENSRNSTHFPAESLPLSIGIPPEKVRNSNVISLESIKNSGGILKNSTGIPPENIPLSTKIPLENALKREGEGEGEGKGEGDLFKKHSVPNGTEQSSKSGLDAQDALFRLAVPWLIERGVMDRSARSLLGAAVKQLGAMEAWELAQRCMQEKPLEPAGWLAAGIQAQMKSTKRMVGQVVGKQAALEAHNREIAARLIAGRAG